MSEPEAIAAILEGARHARRAVSPPPALTGLTLAQAYANQDALAALRERSGTAVFGWKLGITSEVKQRVMGIAHPLFGRIFADGELAGGARVERSRFIAPRAEPEVAFGLDAPLDPAMDDAALLASVAWIAPALEITDSRYATGTRTAIELVSDNTSSSAYVVGERLPVARAAAFTSAPTTLLRNGEVLAAGSSADVLGNPLEALRLLAAHLASRGGRTRPGDIVLSGAITDAFPMEAGDLAEARLDGLGAVAVAFV